MNHPKLPLWPLVFSLAGCSHGVSADPPPPIARNGNAVTAGATGEPAPVDVSETADDRLVTERIRTRFTQDAELEAAERHVVITTSHHAVVLTGNVATDRERLVMAAHARAIDGVQHLDNRIALTP